VSTDAWQCLADACLEHDVEHEQRACAELVRLGQLIPVPRDPEDGAA
jgi:hypothetical protein